VTLNRQERQAKSRPHEMTLKEPAQQVLNILQLAGWQRNRLILQTAQIASSRPRRLC
jgi:hypothetical protein